VVKLSQNWSVLELVTTRDIFERRPVLNEVIFLRCPLGHQVVVYGPRIAGGLTRPATGPSIFLGATVVV